jgi:large repetitive protein
LVAALASAGVALIVVPALSSAADASSASATVTRILVGNTNSANSVAVAVDTATNTVYAAVQSSDPGIAVIDGATDTVAAFIGTASEPTNVAVDPVTDTVYATGRYPSAVTVIDGATNEVTSTISLGSAVTDTPLAVNPDTDTIYVSTYGPAGYDVQVIDGGTAKIQASIPVAYPGNLAVDTATGAVYVGDQQAVQVIDGSTMEVTDTIALPHGPGEGLAVDPDAGAVFVSTSVGLDVISAATSTLQAFDNGVGDSSDLAVDPASGTVYASTTIDGQQGTTSVLPESAVLAGTTRPGLDLPRGGGSVAVDSATGVAYVTGDPGSTSRMAGYVSVIVPSSSLQICPVIQSQAIPQFEVGQPESYSFFVSAAPPATLTESGTLPAGVTFTGGDLSGTPAAGTGGQYVFELTASNGVNPGDTETQVLTVVQPAALGPVPASATFRTGVAGSVTFTATGYPAPEIQLIGTLPAGLSESSSGLLSGTPAAHAGGRYQLTVGASNPYGSAAAPFTLLVHQPPSFSSSSKVTFRPGVRHSFKIRALGYPVPRLKFSGKLPKGLTLRVSSNGTATISGAVSRHAKRHTYKIDITATNGIGPAVTQVLSLTVS